MVGLAVLGQWLDLMILEALLQPKKFYDSSAVKSNEQSRYLKQTRGTEQDCTRFSALPESLLTGTGLAVYCENRTTPTA